MATNMDSALTPFDPEEMGEEPALEIEIEDPESVSLKTGDVEITLEPEPETADDFDANLAEYRSEEHTSELQSH